MFNNIGRKIKGLAKFLFWITVIFFVIIAIALVALAPRFFGDEGTAIAIIGAIFAIVFGVIIAWLSNFMLYGFGELIDSNQRMLRILEQRNTPAPAPRPAEPSGIEQ